jgi:radical SAM superfamily enzyme with C-terminal helix-hairpin-helix motif
MGLHGDTPEATDRTLDYIQQLMDRRIVTQTVAERMIKMLEDAPVRNDNGLSTPNTRPEYVHP